MMTARERLFAALSGEPTDRTPIWLLFPYHHVPYYADVRNHPQYRPVHDAALRSAITLDRRHFGVSLHTDAVTRTSQETTENGVTLSRQTIACQGRPLCREVRQRHDCSEVKPFLTSPEELAFYCSLPIELRSDRLLPVLEQQFAAYQREKQEFPPDAGSMMLDLGEPIHALYHLSDLAEYAVWSLTHPDLIVAFLDRVMAQKRLVYRYCLERDLADVYFLVGSELAAPPLVSRTTFRRWIMPYARELIEMIHGHGKKVILHFHGQIKEILPDFAELAPDGLHTIEAPPIGNCTLSEAFEITENRITLIGNIQYDCFRSYTPQQMAAAVREVCAEARGKRFILSPSAGPYEETVPDRVIENYLAFLAAGWEYQA